MQSSKATSTDWQEDALGRRFKENEAGVRLYQMKTVNRLVPLGQYFHSKIYDKYRNTTIAYFRDDYAPELKRNKKFALGYVKHFQRIKEQGKGYYLYSEKPGSGKTMLACCILNGLSQQHEATTQAITVVDLLKRIRDTYSNEDRSEEAVINPVLAVDVLLLDDCGTEKHSEWVDEQLYHIVDSRLSAGKPTFYTSNYSIDQLPYHKRIKSRINAGTAQIAMPEKDIRALVNAEQEAEFLNKIIQ